MHKAAPKNDRKFAVRQIFTLVIFFTLLLLSAGNAEAGTASDQVIDTVSVRGKLTIVDSTRNLDGITVRINGKSIQSDTAGHYRLKISRADVYQFEITRDDLFQTIHSFAHSELGKTASSIVNIPTIEMVEKKPGRVELIFGGDVMMGRRYLKPRWNEPQLIHADTRASDMDKLVRPMQPYFAPADFAAVNLETVLSFSDPGTHAPKSVVFYTHPQVLGALNTLGVDYVSLGNNHVYDYLDNGLHSTIDLLDTSGLGYSGAGVNEEEALRPYRTTIKGQPYSMLGFVGWKGRVAPNQVAEENKAGAALGTAENITSSVAREAKAGRATIVQYHGSREYSEEPTEITEKRLKVAIDAGADLVVGHHPHVAHGLELYNGKLIAYSLGNFIFDQFIYEAQAAYALKVWMDGDAFYRAEIIPVHLRAYRPVPAMANVRQNILQRVFHLSAKRGTHMHMSGGHGIITQKSTSRDAGRAFALSPGQDGGKIGRFDFQLDGSSSKPRLVQEKVVLGRDLLFRGDFESSALLNIESRTWEISNGEKSLVRNAHRGQFAQSIMGAADCKSTQFGLKTFLRVLDQENYSFTGWIKVSGKTKISATMQHRPKGMDRYKALATIPYQPLGSDIVDDKGWTEFKFDFTPNKSADGKALPLRVMLNFEPLDKACKQREYLVDDIALIGWNSGIENQNRNEPSRSTHFRYTD